jgi:hypothetical protein
MITQDQLYAQITKELKGVPIESLEQKIGGSEAVKPVYLSQTFNYALPDRKECKIAQFVPLKSISNPNEFILDALMNGANALFLDFSNTENVHFDEIFKDVNFELIDVHFRYMNAEIISILENFISTKKLSLTGSSDESIKGIETLYFNTKALDIETTVSKLAELIKSDTTQNILFEIEINNDYFKNMAYFRAVKMLGDSILNKINSNATFEILAVSSLDNKTAENIHTNILRLTTEAMSAITGGADTLMLRPFSEGLEENSNMSHRISRNIHHLLKEEGMLEKSNDPAQGAYYIESLTNAYLESIWSATQKSL